MAILLAYRPLQGRVGETMLWCVGGFGVFTIVFGLSRNLVLSLLALILVGASDMVSVVIRVTLLTANDSRSDARASECRGYGFHWCVQRVGSI